jgi:hypothetical protein
MRGVFRVYRLHHPEAAIIVGRNAPAHGGLSPTFLLRFGSGVGAALHHFFAVTHWKQLLLGARSAGMPPLVRGLRYLLLPSNAFRQLNLEGLTLRPGSRATSNKGQAFLIEGGTAMFASVSKWRRLGLFAFLAACLATVSLDAQPPGAETRTVRSSVREFTTAPKGEVDGAILADGTVVHWPPHLGDRFSNIISKGDNVKVIGWMETGPKGDTKLEVSTLTNVRTNKMIENQDRSPPAGQDRVQPGQAGGIERRLQTLEDRMDELTQEIRRLRSKK